MVQPTVKLEVNTNTEGSPTWSEVTSAQELVFTTSDMTGSKAQDAIPFITKPGSGVVVVDMLWKGASGNYTNIAVYAAEPNANKNVARWTWDGAMNSAPIFTCYPTTAHANPTAGDGSVLGGHSADTSSKSYCKSIFDPGASAWCTGTTGQAGAVTTTNVGQSLQGEIQYLQLWSTPTGSGVQTLNVCMYVGANENTGTFTPVFSCKYTWT